MYACGHGGAVGDQPAPWGGCLGCFSLPVLTRKRARLPWRCPAARGARFSSRRTGACVPARMRHAGGRVPWGTNRRPGVGAWRVSHWPASLESAPACPGGARLHVGPVLAAGARVAARKPAQVALPHGLATAKNSPHETMPLPMAPQRPTTSPSPVVVHPRHTKCLFHAALPGTSHGVEGKGYGAVCAKY